MAGWALVGVAHCQPMAQRRNLSRGLGISAPTFKNVTCKERQQVLGSNIHKQVHKKQPANSVSFPAPLRELWLRNAPGPALGKGADWTRALAQKEPGGRV